METSAIVNIVLSVLSFLLAAISIIFVALTLKQNNKILEEANRPNITVFFDSITSTKRTNYFVIKNFGSSAGTIKKFIFPDELKTSPQTHKLFNEQFDCVEGMTLAPGQSKLFPYDVSLLKNSVHFEITYTSNFSKKEYTETVDIDTQKMAHIPISRPSVSATEKQPMHNLVTTLHDLVEKQI